MTNDDKVVPISAEARRRQQDMRGLVKTARDCAIEILQRSAAQNRSFNREMRFYGTVTKVMIIAVPALLIWGGYSFWQATYGQVNVAIPAECPNVAELRDVYDPFDGKQTVVFMPDGIITNCQRLPPAEADALILKPGVVRGHIYP